MAILLNSRLQYVYPIEALSESIDRHNQKCSAEISDASQKLLREQTAIKCMKTGTKEEENKVRGLLSCDTELRKCIGYTIDLMGLVFTEPGMPSP